MSKANKRKGFSLAEALITLLLVAICAVLSVPVFKKKEQKLQYETHGSYECYMTEDSYIEYKRSAKGTITSTKEVSSCKFVPPKSAAEFHVDICARNAELYNCNHDDGSHTYMFFPSLKTVGGIKKDNEKVYFGDIFFALYKGGDSRILVVY